MYLDALLPHAQLVRESEAKGFRQACYAMVPETGLEGIFEYTALEGFEINYSNITVARHTAVQLNASKQYVEMHFSLSGRFLSRNEKLIKPLLVKDLQHSLFSVPQNLTSGLEFQSDKRPLVKVDILFNKNYFEHIAHEDCALHTTLLDKLACNDRMPADIGMMDVTPHLLSVLTDIITCKRTGYFGRMFLEARVLELFMLQTEALQEALPGKGCGYLMDFSRDIEKLYFVKELIDKEPETDHSLQKLSRQAGLNVFKLKNGFKSLFGDTVFGYINSLRMEKARKMLLEGAPINTIAYQLGYSSPNNFSTAFKRKYGITPGKFKA
ncbi:AraC family transcriptional regulator [Chitinophaga sp. HK235]|uniref:AraC family transcriptional regulator n=1 Tax=Chitinophaga sp. HK235 TaxID=2952571 RepID=UPI001BA749CC|nr:AraC family transcriptional regulator [Chitinophaga sp. HK235]